MRILVGFILDGKTGGIDKYLTNLLDVCYKQNRSIQFDFLTNKSNPRLIVLLNKYNSKIFEIASLKHPFKQFRQVKECILENDYDAVYLNISTAINFVAAYAAKKSGVQKRIIHSHSSGNAIDSAFIRITMDILHKICKRFLCNQATDYFACSKAAGYWLFPKKTVESAAFRVIPNAIDVDHFFHDPKIREEVRTRMGLQGKFVLGHAGSFDYPKNHCFLLEVFKEVQKKEPESVLMLAGDGPFAARIRNLAEKMGISNNILFLGQRQDVNDLMQAMDAFIFPSHFEGLGIAVIEAQACGLQCFLSNTVPQEADLTGNCVYLQIGSKACAAAWAKAILEKRQDFVRVSQQKRIQEQGYDLTHFNASDLFVNRIKE